MSLRPAQKTLRLDAPSGDASPESQRWRDGDTLTFLGAPLTLYIDTDSTIDTPERSGDVLHLHLPPKASARQIQDAAEAWLRREASALFTDIITRECTARSLSAPRLQLSFALRSGWVEIEAPSAQSPGRIKCNWRLIELPPATIADVLGKALGKLAAMSANACAPDLFS
jgi:predicted metal-dependent hydrolase